MLVWAVVCSLVLLAGVPQVRAEGTVVSPVVGDMETEMLGGSSFKTPNGWTALTIGNRIDIVSPEKDLTISFIERQLKGKAIEELASVWEEVRPGFKLKEWQRSSPPPKDGWEELHQIVYETRAEESRVVLAFVRVFKGKGYVNLVDGTASALSRRGAQLWIAVESWKPQGLTVSSLAGRAARTWGKIEAKEFESFVQQSMGTLQIPGASIAIVQNGKVVYLSALGVKSIESGEPVSDKTLFLIGSMTKPLTTLMMAKQIELKKFDWSTPVVQMLPGFGLADPETTSKIQIRHTACACTGMPRQDLGFIFEYDGISAEKRIEQMRSMKPTTAFGETFQYSNFLVAAGGLAAAHVYDKKSELGVAYAAAMKALIFDPIRMTDTVSRVREARTKDAAFPHARNFNGEVERIPDRIEEAVDSVAPAGAVWSNASDISKYLQVELAKGRRGDGKRVFSESSVLARWKPGVKVGDSTAYGLGLFVDEFQGLKIIGHGGNTLGFSSDMYFIPEKGMGVVVLTNAAGANRFLSAVKQKFMEITFGAEAHASQLVEYAVRTRKESLSKSQSRISVDPKKVSWMASLVGDYSNPELGLLKVSKTGEKYFADVGEWSSQLGSTADVGGERLVTLVSPPWSGGLDFRVVGRDLVLDDGQHKYVFKKK